MQTDGLKPAAAADAAAERDAEEAAARARLWWRRAPRVVTAPRDVFRALGHTDELDLEARAEPVLAIAILAGMAGLLLTPTWGTLLDDRAVDGLVVLVLTFIGGVVYGFAGSFVLGLAVWLGLKGASVAVPLRSARHVVVFAALPFALSLIVTVPAIALAFGWDWFRSGGADEGTGRTIVVLVGLAFAAWSLGLLVLGLRECFRLPWRGVAGALGLAAVTVAALVVLPSAL